MEKLTATYSAEELAWVTPATELKRDVYLIVTLKRPGKLVVRQDAGDGKWTRLPIGKHRDMTLFELRVCVVPTCVKIRIFTSTEPKDIKYAYI